MPATAALAFYTHHTQSKSLFGTNLSSGGSSWTSFTSGTFPVTHWVSPTYRFAATPSFAVALLSATTYRAGATTGTTVRDDFSVEAGSRSVDSVSLVAKRRTTGRVVAVGSSWVLGAAPGDTFNTSGFSLVTGGHLFLARCGVIRQSQADVFCR